MKKQNKIDFINKVFERFDGASNHGNGNNWFYPTSNVIAYDVKMHNFGDVETFREGLSKLQNSLITDDFIYDCMNNNQNFEAECLIDDIKEVFGLESWYAGRSGGWLEVQFENGLPSDYELDNYTSSDIQEVYQEAKDMEDMEDKVAQYIKDGHRGLNDYIDSDSYYSELKDTFLANEYIKDDKDIKHDIKMASSLGDLLNSSDETIRRHARGINKIL